MATANDYIDYTLLTVAPGVNRYTNTVDKGGVVVDHIDGVARKIVGTVYSWVLDSYGSVWWQLYETYAPDKPMYVKHDESLLVPVAPGSVNTVINTPGLLTDLAAAGGNVLNAASSAASKFFQPVLLAAGAVFTILLISRYRSK